MPARAPASIAMLQTVMRSSIERDRTVGPRYSITCPAAPSAPRRAIRARLRSFAVTPGPRRPSTSTASVRGRSWSRHCVASTCATSLVPMPNASAPSAPCVLVWLSPQTIVRPGCVRPSSGAITCTMPCRSWPSPYRVMPAPRVLAVELRDLPRRLGIGGNERAWRPRRGGDRVVHRRERAVGTPHRQTALAQHRERLRRRDLVQQVQVDVEHRRRVGGGRAHHVRVPDLLEQRARGRAHRPSHPRPGLMRPPAPTRAAPAAER